MHSTQESRWDTSGDTQASKHVLQHWSAVVGGSALAVLGVTRRSPAGWALAAAGGALAYAGVRSTSNGSAQRNPELGSNILVNASPQEAYRLWRNVEKAPQYMHRIESVEDLDDRRAKWTAAGPMGVPVQWTSEISDEREGEYIAWRSLPGSDLSVSGRVEFKKAPGNRGTIVHSQMQFHPANRSLRAAGSGFFGRQARFFMRQDLRRFKALLETGEIPTTKGQPHGPRSRMDRAAQAINPDRKRHTSRRATHAVESLRRVS